MTVYGPGTKVRLKAGIDAMVCVVKLYPSGVEYTVTWWDGNIRNQQDIYDLEIEGEAPTCEIKFLRKS
jgi:hypothetical protein